MVYVIFGAGGGTGLECVKRLLEQGTGKVRAVVRDPGTYVLPSHPNLEVVRGDVTDAASCRLACAGAEGVVFAASGRGYWSAYYVDCKGVENVGRAALEGKAGRVVLVSSMLVTTQNRWNPLRMLLNNMRYCLMDYKLQGEEALRKLGGSYTIIRPGGLTRGPGGQSRLRVEQGDRPIPGGRSITRADLAALCVEALTNPQAEHVTLEVVAVPVMAEAGGAKLEQQLKEVWKGLKPDA